MAFKTAVSRSSTSRCSFAPSPSPVSFLRGGPAVISQRRCNSASPRSATTAWAEKGTQVQSVAQGQKVKPEAQAPPSPDTGAAASEAGSDNSTNQWPLVKVSALQNIGASAAFMKRSLKNRGRALMVCRSPDAMYQSVRILRCAGTMMTEDDQHVPIFQPTLLQKESKGKEQKGKEQKGKEQKGKEQKGKEQKDKENKESDFSAGSTMLYTFKTLKGNFDIPDTLRVSSKSDASKLSGAIMGRIKQHGACVLECFGKVPAATCIKALSLARRTLITERMDIGVILDPRVVEVNAEDIATTLMNRFVVLECEVRNPRKLRVKVEARVGPVGLASR